MEKVFSLSVGRGKDCFYSADEVWKRKLWVRFTAASDAAGEQPNIQVVFLASESSSQYEL